MDKKRAKIIIIDGYNIVFRAYHSVPPLTRSDGVQVNAVYGFVSMIIKLLNNLKSEYIAIALDSGSKTFRNEIYSEYKAHRPEAPEDLKPQFEIIKESIEALNVKILQKKGYEADDLIATYTKKANKNGFEVVIVSSDKDLMQLIRDDEVTLYDAMRERIYNEQAVEDKFGVKPLQLLDLFSLVGDSSDNVPGVPSIGPKTAAELLKQYQTLDGVYNSLDEIKQKKRKQVLTDNKDKAYLSKKLITLKEDVSYHLEIEHLKRNDICSDVFIEFLKKQNFNSLIPRVKINIDDKHQIKQLNKVENVLIDSINKLEDFFSEAVIKGKISLIASLEKGVLRLELYNSNKKTEILISHAKVQTDILNPKMNFESSEVKQIIFNILENESVHKVCFNIKLLLVFFNSPIIKSFDDLQIMAYVANNTYPVESISLISYKLLGIEISPEDQSDYMFELYNHIKHELCDKKLFWLYESIEKPIITIIAMCERVGIEISKNKIDELSALFRNKIISCEKNIYQICGKEFNIGSPKQLSQILFDDLNLLPKNKKKSTNNEVLEELVLQGHKIAEFLIDWRHYSKLLSTYTSSLLKEVDKDNRIHTTFNLHKTSTGRISSSNPNLQNIPIRSNEGKLVRSAFIAKKGYKFITADYSQIELRILAYIANVASLKHAFENNIDIHTATAAKIFGLAIDKVESDIRRKAKFINFGIIYGMSSFGLASRLGIDIKLAAEYIEEYFIQYPEIKKYMSDTIEKAKKNGYVTTVFGRRCYLDNITSRVYNLRSFAERAAINAPIQGTQADIIKLAMKKVCHKLAKNNLDVNLLLQIHDELIFEVKEEDLEKTRAIIKKEMNNIELFPEKLVVNISEGNNWFDL